MNDLMKGLGRVCLGSLAGAALGAASFFAIQALDPAPAMALTTKERGKAAAAYWKAACDVKHGHVARYEAGAQATKYIRELGISPEAAYADASVTTTAEMLDRKAGTNCLGG